MQKILRLMDKQKTGKRRRVIDLNFYRSYFFFKLKLKNLFAFKNNNKKKGYYFLFSCPFWGLRIFLSPERDAKFYRRFGFHVLMPVQKQNTEINSSDALYRQSFKSPELVSVFALDY